MFVIKTFIYLNIISLIIAQNEYNVHNLLKFHDDNDPIIDPLELVLNSTDTEGFFYCNSRIDINKQRNKFVASFDNPIPTSPTFQLKTEQINSTTIRIRISPNGSIGINRISCHWDDNVTYGQTADLIIGEKPGVIRLKEHCRAYDRRYVQCIFHAPIIARAFRNGFPRLYQFSELNSDTSSYRDPPILVNITNKNELIFHFEPRDRNIIPKTIRMSVNMTLSRFGSSIYKFSIEPIHTTKVDFLFENISNRHLTIRINHNNIGTIIQRLCSGHVSQVNDQKTLTQIQDITETSNQTIEINHLLPSTKYQICLRCFYEKTDHSFKEQKCRTIETISKFSKWYILLIVVAGISALTLIIWILQKQKNNLFKCGCYNKPISDSRNKRSNDSETIHLDHQMEPQPTDRLITPSDSSSTFHRNPIDDEKYQPMIGVMEQMTDRNKISPDTVDLSN